MPSPTDVMQVGAPPLPLGMLTAGAVTVFELLAGFEFVVVTHFDF
jgi:hypothetical protein